MKSSFLVTRPNHEQTTKYLFCWAEETIKKAKEGNVFTLDLGGEKASRKNFAKFLKRFKPSFVYLNGHGSANLVTGFNNEPILSFASNEELTKDKVVYALSCQSARRLGKSCVSSGARAYLGYDEDFIFVFDEESQENPSEDKTASFFLEPSNNLVFSLLDGETTGKAYLDSQESFNQNIVKFSLSDAEAEEKELLPYLLWDREHQVCLGDKEVKCEFISEEEYWKGQKIKFLGLAVGICLLLGLLIRILTIFG